MRSTSFLLTFVPILLVIALLVNDVCLTSHADATNVASRSAAVQPVNRIVGDTGYVARFGERPGPGADEDIRIESHLMFVEELLREKTMEHLTTAQQRRRAEALDHLWAYRTAGVYPRNTERPDGRTPVFIDARGRICAVGYLIQQTAGRDAAEQINAQYRFAYVDDMALPWLRAWADENGLSVHELAMIQPAYQPPPDETQDDKIDRKLEVASIGLNVSSALVNGWMIHRHRTSGVAAGAGLLAGGAGLAIGLSDRSRYTTPDLVAAGASVLLSGWHLLRRIPPPAYQSELRPAVNPILVPVENGGSRLGLQARWDF